MQSSSVRPLTLLNALLLFLAAVALVLLLVRSDASPGVEVARADPPPGVDEIRVHVLGAVATPGVVRAEPGERVEDVILRAGGALPDADLDALNLALRVRDEDTVDVPRIGEVAASALIDINSATQDELESLPGIGPARSRDIIEGRPYGHTDELLERGILTASVYDEIRTLVAAR